LTTFGGKADDRPAKVRPNMRPPTNPTLWKAERARRGKNAAPGVETTGGAKPRTALAFEFHRSSGQFYTDRAWPFAPQ
jgi:hypothetical protein